MARNRQAEQVRTNLEALISGAVRDLTLEVAANLTTDAPVDTGHVKRSFIPSVGEPAEGEDDGSGAAQAKGTAEVLTYRIEQGPTFVVNNVPYLQYLILGSSDQAPAGWDLAAVDRAVATTQQRYDGLRLDVTASSTVSDRGAHAAAGMAAAYSPFGGDE